MLMSHASGALLGSLGRLRGYIRKRVRDPERTEDVLQETMARVLEQERRQTIEHPMAYACRIADSVIFAQARKTVDSIDLDALELVCDRPLPDTVLDYRQRLARFDAALARLSPTRRAVFRLRHIEGKARQDIAQELDLSLEAVKKHLVRAMAELARSLENNLEPSAKGQIENA
ncbi:sigma-70 family RNA polymerase sigma factor [Novosphingobium profundi]|uniref:RNA polymerase sigma factor n=1 Tax=Novosphingobium profundi TaxID=1774954 RepID=UPI001BDA35E7|nr:sigma-70 family RNA polymerase sigma factor [Novosphingobium profundi]MBT0667094.1 sigma-70 family RNA polymerase sigma factor [Novosphingobium profundi]